MILAKFTPQLFGRSADLASLNKTLLKGEADFNSEDYTARNIWFGVREFGMGAAVIDHFNKRKRVAPIDATLFLVCQAWQLSRW